MMCGMRKPSPKKSLSARTKGQATHAVKRAVNPLYGKKGMAFIRDPKRAVKNNIYKRTTFGIGDLFK